MNHSLSLAAEPALIAPRAPTGSIDALTRLLDRTLHHLHTFDLNALNDFGDALMCYREGLTPEAWRATASPLIDQHPIAQLLRTEPLTRRAFEKPRGYAGDAPMLDLMYSELREFSLNDDLVYRLAAWINRRGAAESVRARRNILAARIDAAASRQRGARVLSVACGHLREAHFSKAMHEHQIGELVALDQDRESIATLHHDKGGFAITPVRASIRRIMRRPTSFGTFDLAYSAGLYDYLEDDIAASLTAALFATLNPGGELVIANFAPSLPDIGYMEAVMDWHPIYRDEAAMMRLLSGVPETETADTVVSRDPIGHVVYLTVRRR